VGVNTEKSEPGGGGGRGVESETMPMGGQGHFISRLKFQTGKCA
jgi:hypothetical protein